VHLPACRRHTVKPEKYHERNRMGASWSGWTSRRRRDKPHPTNGRQATSTPDGNGTATPEFINAAAGPKKPFTGHRCARRHPSRQSKSGRVAAPGDVTETYCRGARTTALTAGVNFSSGRVRPAPVPCRLRKRRPRAAYGTNLIPQRPRRGPFDGTHVRKKSERE